ncbi:MAG: hypothetical protein OJF49_001552 [Ktedonobacterales bacterium]|nr:MAG: hypothetical protein OJF49_001552 [Ktedonobacterales bacterium]
MLYDMTPRYPSDLSDAEWDRLQRLLPPRSPHARLRQSAVERALSSEERACTQGCT